MQSHYDAVNPTVNQATWTVDLSNPNLAAARLQFWMAALRPVLGRRWRRRRRHQR